MKIKLKPLGIIDRCNGVEVRQTMYYTKINTATYIKNILINKKCTDKPSHNLPLPISKHTTYNRKIETVKPLDNKNLQQTEK